MFIVKTRNNNLNRLDNEGMDEIQIKFTHLKNNARHVSILSLNVHELA